MLALWCGRSTPVATGTRTPRTNKPFGAPWRQPFPALPVSIRGSRVLALCRSWSPQLQPKARESQATRGRTKRLAPPGGSPCPQWQRQQGVSCVVLPHAQIALPTRTAATLTTFSRPLVTLSCSSHRLSQRRGVVVYRQRQARWTRSLFAFVTHPCLKKTRDNVVGGHGSVCARHALDVQHDFWHGWCGRRDLEPDSHGQILCKIFIGANVNT